MLEIGIVQIVQFAQADAGDVAAFAERLVFGDRQSGLDFAAPSPTPNCGRRRKGKAAPLSPSVQAWHVRGDGLSLAQDGNWGLPRTAGRRILLDPVARRSTGSIASRFTQIRTRNLRLHKIAEMRASLDMRAAEIARLQEEKGCPV